MRWVLKGLLAAALVVGAGYLFVYGVDGVREVEVARLENVCSTPFDGMEDVSLGASFGAAMDMNENWLVISEPDANKVYAFAKSVDADGITRFAPPITITPPADAPNTGFGRDVALYNDQLFIGQADDLVGKMAKDVKMAMYENSRSSNRVELNQSFLWQDLDLALSGMYQVNLTAPLVEARPFLIDTWTNENSERHSFEIADGTLYLIETISQDGEPYSELKSYDLQSSQAGTEILWSDYGVVLDFKIVGDVFSIYHSNQRPNNHWVKNKDVFRFEGNGREPLPVRIGAPDFQASLLRRHMFVPTDDNNGHDMWLLKLPLDGLKQNPFKLVNVLPSDKVNLVPNLFIPSQTVYRFDDEKQEARDFDVLEMRFSSIQSLYINLLIEEGRESGYYVLLEEQDEVVLLDITSKYSFFSLPKEYFSHWFKRLPEERYNMTSWFREEFNILVECGGDYE